MECLYYEQGCLIYGSCRFSNNPSLCSDYEPDLSIEEKFNEECE